MTSPEREEYSKNLGKDINRKEPLYKEKHDQLPDEGNFQSFLTPDEALMNKEDEELKGKIRNLRQRIENLSADDLMRDLQEGRIQKMLDEIGINESTFLLQEINRLQTEIYPLDLKDMMRKAKENIIARMTERLKQIKQQSDQPEKLAA